MDLKIFGLVWFLKTSLEWKSLQIFTISRILYLEEPPWPVLDATVINTWILRFFACMIFKTSLEWESLQIFTISHILYLEEPSWLVLDATVINTWIVWFFIWNWWTNCVKGLQNIKSTMLHWFSHGISLKKWNQYFMYHLV